MGIKGLTRFISRCGKLTLYESYASQWVAIDALQKIYNRCLAKLNVGEITNEHVKSIINCIVQLTKYGIKPMFIFDGTSVYFKIKHKEQQNIQPSKDGTVCDVTVNIKDGMMGCDKKDEVRNEMRIVKDGINDDIKIKGDVKDDEIDTVKDCVSDDIGIKKDVKSEKIDIVKDGIIDGIRIKEGVKCDKIDIVKGVVKDIVENVINKVSSETKHTQPRKQFKIEPKQIRECEKLIHLIGFPCIRAPYEADSQCAAMTMKNSHVKMGTIITNDTDALAFGSSSILKMIQINIVSQLRQLFNDFIRKYNDSIICKKRVFDPKRAQCLRTKRYSDFDNLMYSINDMLTILGRTDQIKYFDDRLNINEKYPVSVIKKFCDMRNISFALKFELDDVLSYFTRSANKILIEHKKTLISSFSQKCFIDLCILLGTDYMTIPITKKKLSESDTDPIIISEKESHTETIGDRQLSTEEIFEAYVLCNFNIKNVIDNMTVLSDIKKNECMETVEIVREYYMNATVIDPNTIDMKINPAKNKEITELLDPMGFDVGYVDYVLKLYDRTCHKYNMCSEKPHMQSIILPNPANHEKLLPTIEKKFQIV